MTPDRARAAVAAIIVQAIPDSAAEMIAGWTEAQWRGFVVGMAAGGPLMWGAVERRDLVGVMQGSQLCDQVGEVARYAPELLGLPPDPREPTPAELLAEISGPELEQLLPEPELRLEPCPACQGTGVVLPPPLSAE